MVTLRTDLTTIFMFLFATILAVVAKSETTGWLEAVPRWIVRRNARLIPDEDRDRWVNEQLADLAHRPGGILTHILTALWDGLAAQWQEWKLDPAPNRVRLRRFMDRTQSVVYALLVVNVGWGTLDNYLHDRPFDPIMTAPGLAGAAGLGILVCGTWLRWRRRRMPVPVGTSLTLMWNVEAPTHHRD